MKIWFAIVLLTAVVLSATAADVAKANRASISTEVVKADVADSTLVPTGNEEDAETTKSTLIAVTGEKSERDKDKPEKQKDVGEQEKEENEENENEEGENEEEDSDEGDSEEEDSEESEGKGISKKKKAKVESEEENNNNNKKADDFEVPSAVPIWSRPTDLPVAIQPHKPADAPRSGPRTSQPENSFSPAKSSHETTAVRSPNVEISTHKPSAVQFPFWSRPADPAKPLDGAGPVSHSTEFHQSEAGKANHPKWFFNTPKAKPSEDSFVKKESSKPFVAEIPISKSTKVQVPTWPITTTRPAARESYRPAVSQLDHAEWAQPQKTQPKWYYNAAPKPSEGFVKKENSQPVDIVSPPRKSAAVHAQPWSKPAIPSLAPPTVNLPVYKATDIFETSTRKTYPRWFFNIKN